MEISEVERLVAKLDGHLRAFAMINSTYFDYSSGASMSKLENNNLQNSLSDYLDSNLKEMRQAFDDIEFSDYTLDKLETINPWIGHLEEHLKKLLLPDPFKHSDRIDNETLERVRSQVSWHVMEIIKSLSNGFSNKEIYFINYKRQDGSKGCYYLIPVAGRHLLLNFCKNN